MFRRLSPPRLLTFLVLIVLSGLVFFWTPPHSAAPPVIRLHPVTAAAAQSACGQATLAPPRYDHIIWIMEENKSVSDVIGRSTTPFLTELATTCGYSTNFVDTEPRSLLGKGYHSLSHYVALVSGSDCASGNGTGPNCITNDAKNPLRYALATSSLFQQIEEAGLTWKSYQESSPGNCSMQSKGAYVARHDAALYFLPIRATCRTNDVPLPAYNLTGTPSGEFMQDIQNNTLPTFAYVTPNLNHDMHDGTPEQADIWLQEYLTPLFQSATYQQGRTAVFILWDEASLNNQSIANVFIAPTIHSGAVHVAMSGFAVLRATENLLNLPYLGCASGQPPGNKGTCYPGATTDLRSVFGF